MDISLWQLAVLAGVTLGVFWRLKRQSMLRSLPPMIPASELGWPGILAYPLMGHVALLSQPLRLFELAKKYGKPGEEVVMLWFFSAPWIWYGKPDFNRDLYGLPGCENPENAKILANQPRNAVATFLVGNSDYNGPSFKRLRKFITTNVLSATHVRKMTGIVNDEVKLFLNYVAESAVKRQPLIINKRLKSVGFRVMARILFGSNIEPTGDLLETLETYLDVLLSPSLGGAFPFLWKIDPICQAAEKCLPKFTQFVDQAVADYKAGVYNKQGEQSPFLASVVQQLEEGSISMEDVHRAFGSLFVAGIDTLFSLPCCLFQLMADNPEIQVKAQEEIEGVVGPNRLVEVDDIAKLPYCRAAMKDSVRLRPLSNTFPPRRAGSTFSWHGYQFPADTVVLPPVFNTDFESRKLEPERFSDDDLLEGTRSEWFPLFGGGPRSCPGAKLGTYQVMLLACNVLHCFHLASADGRPVTEKGQLDRFMLRPAERSIAFTLRRNPADLDGLHFSH